MVGRSALPAALLLASLTSLPAADAPAPRPEIHWEGTVHNFGTIRSSQKQSFSWAYRNVGTAPLEILNTFPSCGCTVASAGGEIAPGAAGSMEVSFDPTGEEGDVRKTIAVVTNDPVHPRTILTLKAKIIPAEEETAPGGHPRFTGQSLLVGSCASCHATPARGKSGEALYAAVCSQCHGPKALGGRAPSLRDPGYLAGHDDKALGEAIAYGTANPKMPGFSELMGGPLSAVQVASLVALLRTWGPSSASPTASPPPAKR
jgi:mono/diheme cytochrome c family protein